MLISADSRVVETGDLWIRNAQDDALLASTWPESVNSIEDERTEATLSDEIVRKLMIDKSARSYGIDVDIVREPSPSVPARLASV